MKNRYLLLLLPLVVACTPHSDLKAWMDETKQQAAGKVKKAEVAELPQLAGYEPPVFSGLHAFDATRFSLARKSSVGRDAPDLNRPREILEGFGLDKIQYVGSMQKSGQWLAFVKVDDYVYTVKVGNHMGSDFGVVKLITPEKIVLEETRQNAEGEWVHHPAEISLFVN